MIFRLIMILFLCTNTVTAMDINKFTIENLNDDMPPNFREIMPRDLIQCSQLASDGEFEKGVDLLKQTDKKSASKTEIYSQILSDLKEVYVLSKEEFVPQQSTFDASITEKDYLYNQFLRYFWWSHYVYVYEGLVEDDITLSNSK